MSNSRKRIAIYPRVSTEEQAAKDENSLNNQEHRCREWLRRSGFSDEDIAAARIYREEGFSGKDTNRPEYQRLIRDIRAGKIDVLIFTELSRMSRSVVDFLALSRFLESQGVEFISVKERFDTTTPAGRVMIVMLMALYQFERETTAARTKAAMRDRAERGLWSGGNVPTGYEPDPDRSGHLRIVDSEAALVRDAFRLYLETGSRSGTLRVLKEMGHRLRERVSRRGKVRPARAVSDGVLSYMLQNPTYIALKEVNLANKGLPEEEQVGLDERDRYYTVPAVWKPIVDEETFEAVQVLRAKNRATYTNNVRPKQHDYVLQGLVRCGDCGRVLHGASTHKKLQDGGRNYYFYYQHLGRAPRGCSRKSISAEQLEALILGRLKDLAGRKSMLDEIVVEANQRIDTGVPAQKRILDAAVRRLADLEHEQVDFTSRFKSAPGGAVPAFLWAQAEELQAQVEAAKLQVARERQCLEDIETASLNAADYRKLLRDFGRVYGKLNPHEKQKLLANVVDDITVTQNELRLRLVGPEAGVLSLKDDRLHGLVQPVKWLPVAGCM